MGAKANPVPTGYSTSDSFFASRFKQGGRTVYSLDLSPAQLIGLIPRPDPERVLDSNRMIRPKHAEGFADYFRSHKEWVIPSLILRTPKNFKFTVQDEVAGSSFGIVEIERSVARDITILDGQHRTLGFYLAAEGINIDLDKEREKLQKAERQDPGGAAPAQYRARIEELHAEAARLENERIAVQVYVEADAEAYRQMFFDISDNALGITASVRARFDSRKVVNRALPLVLEHPLLKNRVEMELDRVKPTSEQFITARNVAEVIRSSTVGFRGRVSRNQDKDWDERGIAKDAMTFLDILTEAFPPLKAMELGQVLPSQLRKTSLLGSPSILRMLAGLYFELLQENVHGWSRDQVKGYFEKLAPHMTSDGSPVYEGSIWLEHLPEGCFYAGMNAPNGRREGLNATFKGLLDWALDRAAFLDEPPAPRPKPVPELTEEEYLLAQEEAAERRERAAATATKAPTE